MHLLKVRNCVKEKLPQREEEEEKEEQEVNIKISKRSSRLSHLGSEKGNFNENKANKLSEIFSFNIDEKYNDLALFCRSIEKDEDCMEETLYKNQYEFVKTDCLNNKFQINYKISPSSKLKDKIIQKWNNKYEEMFNKKITIDMEDYIDKQLLTKETYIAFDDNLNQIKEKFLTTYISRDDEIITIIDKETNGRNLEKVNEKITKKLKRLK